MEGVPWEADLTQSSSWWRGGREGSCGGARAWEASEGGVSFWASSVVRVGCKLRKRERKKERRKKAERIKGLAFDWRLERDSETWPSGKEEWII